ncbi:branched-chain amino acid transport system ATP-binding protein [Paracoccus aminovorans]|uniref:Branched-chain amino acid transport system ATP-binding protein n=1 Tax=Paracoccus aminovorans TaxID=34004 RepID=A0A1I3B4J3_9RHOB|nr:ABC transporter ATP-binding protein [Paracoccus aminovorans]CQR87566.1 ABC-type branched-chain amino acid transport systems, ATPase component [Paracoccus aminovorans]SFH56879.1 branched-chain amino acid transport system ATP-binding protein [Paracoccus aminovorans]
MLIFDKVSAGYGQSPVLFGLDLDLPRGNVSTLLGKNGMGKTTTVRTIFGLTNRIAGDIVLDGRRINGLAAHQIARMGVALVPEGRQVFPTLTVVENLVATSRDKTARARAAGVQQIFELFPRLQERKRSYANLLSGGEQQMLAIGRALMTRPRFLILDEATEGLAPTIRREIWAALKRLKEEHYTILVIDKSLKPLCKLGDRHNIIRKGERVWSGDSAALAQPEGAAMRLLGI